MIEEKHKMERLVDINSKFDDFVKKYKEFCIDKILTSESDSDNMINDFVNREIPVDSSAYNNDNCLNELNDVDKIIRTLFDSEETFIEAMDSDIAQFNKLYNCWKYGNLDEPGLKRDELKTSVVSGDVVVPGNGRGVPGNGGRAPVPGNGRGVPGNDGTGRGGPGGGGRRRGRDDGGGGRRGGPGDGGGGRRRGPGK